MKVIKAIYNFLVGDMTILIGVALLVLFLALLNLLPAEAFIQHYGMLLLPIAIVLILTISLVREIRPRRR